VLTLVEGVLLDGGPVEAMLAPGRPACSRWSRADLPLADAIAGETYGHLGSGK